MLNLNLRNIRLSMDLPPPPPPPTNFTKIPKKTLRNFSHHIDCNHSYPINALFSQVL